jgi:N-acyl homoserine lactone hydrolase
MRFLPQPPAWSRPLPEARPPADTVLYQLPTGTYETPAALAVRGGSFRDKRQFAASAVLVRHRDGDLLLDAGFGADLTAHLGMLPWFMRSAHHAGPTAHEQLTAAGYDRSRLLGVVLTHSHWDHASGLDSLPDTPIWMNAPERRHASEHWDGKVFRQVSRGREIHEYGFDDGPYLGFASSYDVHGDGAVVIVRAGGHTPGSVIVFVTVSSGARYAFIGDLTWQLDGIRRRVERPWLMGRIADSDPGQVRQDLLRMIALDPMMRIVPAHDLRAYDGIPRLTPETAEQSR